MTHLQQIFEKCQHLTEEENNKLVAEYMKKNDEEAILQEIQSFSNDTMERMKQLEQDIINYKAGQLK